MEIAFFVDGIKIPKQPFLFRLKKIVFLLKHNEGKQIVFLLKKLR